MGQYLCKLGGQRSGPGVNADQVACFFDNDPGGGIGYRKDFVFRLNAFVSDIFLESVGDLLRQVGDLCLFPAFGARMIAFRSSSISLARSFRTSPTLIPARAMSSSRSRFRGFGVLKMIS